LGKTRDFDGQHYEYFLAIQYQQLRGKSKVKSIICKYYGLLVNTKTILCENKNSVSQKYRKREV